MVTRIGLVACAAAKTPHPAAARDLYVSPLFRKAAAWAEANTDRWYVLSAAHHLVRPDTVLEPYDARLGTRTGPPVQEWAARTAEQIRAALTEVPEPHLVVLAGKQYRTMLPLVDAPYEVPMRGLGIGQQLRWLTERLASEGRE